MPQAARLRLASPTQIGQRTPKRRRSANQDQDKGDRSLSPGVPAELGFCMNEADSVLWTREAREPGAWSLALKPGACIRRKYGVLHYLSPPALLD